MPDDGRELSIQTRLHPRLWWILIPVSVGGQAFDMVLDSGSPLSTVSAETYRRLADAGSIRHIGGRRFALTRPLLNGQPLLDFEVRISRRVTRVGADGVLGLDFLGRFTDIHFHVPSLRLTLK